MAKLTKHAEVLNQLHTMVKKQAAEAQKNISGTPGEDVKSKSVSEEHEHHDKNSVKPENNAQSYAQKPSEDSSEPVAEAKTAEDIGAEILDIIRKQAEAQEGIKGEPGKDVKSESVGDDQEKVNKNEVKPENNEQKVEQKASTDESKPVATAKKAEVEELAAKVASYELGRQFCAALMKTASEYSAPNEAELMKQAGRRDFDMLIAEAAENLENPEQQEKQAEQAGAAYFEEVLKEAALQEAIQENQALKEKIASFEAYFQQEMAKQAAENQAAAQQEQQTKLAETVASIVLNQLRSEIANAPVQQ